MEFDAHKIVKKRTAVEFTRRDGLGVGENRGGKSGTDGTFPSFLNQAQGYEL